MGRERRIATMLDKWLKILDVENDILDEHSHFVWKSCES